MNCTCGKNYRYGEGIINEKLLGAYEAKTVPEDFETRAKAVCDMPDGDEKIAAAEGLYDFIQALPITAGRTQDPTEPEIILNWCPEILSPFDYELTDEIKRRASDADRILRSSPQAGVYSLTAEFIKTHPGEFSLCDVIDFLRKNPDSLCCPQKIALKNIDRGIAPEKAASFSNPLRADSNALAMGAAFGIAYPCKPEVAASKAMVYALASHFKGGVYSAMWMASLLSHAACLYDPEVFIVRALNTIPIPTPYFRTVAWMQRNLNCKVELQECADWLHREIIPGNSFCDHSCYANSCAVAAAWLYSEMNAETAEKLLPMFGYETERNMAYVKAVSVLRPADPRI